MQICTVNYCLVCRSYVVCQCTSRSSDSFNPLHPRYNLHNVKVEMPIEELEHILYIQNDPEDLQKDTRETIWNLRAINLSHKEVK